MKGYATHESTAFEKVTAARSAAMGARTAGEHAKTEAMLGQAITGLFGIAEAYPELKANVNFMELQRMNFLILKTKFKQLADSTMQMCVISIPRYKCFQEISLQRCLTSVQWSSSTLKKGMSQKSSRSEVLNFCFFHNTTPHMCGVVLLCLDIL